MGEAHQYRVRKSRTGVGPAVGGRRWFHFYKKMPSFDAPPRPGFVNESALFDASSFAYAWTTDAKRRKIPLMRLGDETVPIANLHIHCKNLAYFAS